MILLLYLQLLRWVWLNVYQLLDLNIILYLNDNLEYVGIANIFFLKLVTFITFSGFGFSITQVLKKVA